MKLDLIEKLTWYEKYRQAEWKLIYFKAPNLSQNIAQSIINPLQPKVFWVKFGLRDIGRIFPLK